MQRRTFLGSLAAGVAAGRLTAPGPVRARAMASSGGFWLPGEAEPHERTFMQWPVSRETYPRRRELDATQRLIAEIANAIVLFEPVVMLMAPAHRAAAQRLLSDAVEIWPIPTDDLWARDSGPLFVRSAAGALAVVDLNFNGWGNRMPNPADARVAARVAEAMGLPLIDSGVVGEGGGVEADGDGTLLAHESSWVNPNRNRLDRAEITARLCAALGAEAMIWAPGVAGRDITDDHIDGLARFVAPGVVMIQLPDRVRPGDPWSASAIETYRVLQDATDARGRRLELVVVPEPASDSPSSYANFYVFNGGVLASTLGDPEADAVAVRVLARLFPGREVMMLDTDVLGALGGGIHCATREQPRV